MVLQREEVMAGSAPHLTASSYEALDDVGRREFMRARIGEVVVHGRGIVVSPT